ncbi:hypothetical protein M9H77_20116 [Catharanthus roseus]|uniref:Uncharacterized protein n=1 Tax=Catharanthus roseus TaxID=4058 RepID=A0ACC0AIS3_CATRO|nr:hypothetical protein M9H77_20116 [Catharanthus roseus]
MGCCLSKNPPPKSVRQQEKSPKSQKCGGGPPPSPPPPLPVEEETVKEVVLSEIPIPKPPSPVVEKIKRPENQDFKVEIQIPEESKPKESTTVVIKPPPAEDIISEVSEQSELCSFTESFSTTTTATALEKRDDGEEVTQRSPVKYRRKRQNTGDLNGNRERNVRSPARRAAPSPERRIPVTSSRPVQGRAMTGQRRNVGPPNGLRRDTGEGSARRSRSPVTRGELVPRRNMKYKNPGLGDTGKPPGGRSPARTAENVSKVEKQNDSIVPERKEMEKQNDNPSPENGESIENPLVSLECFIFL